MNKFYKEEMQKMKDNKYCKDCGIRTEASPFMAGWHNAEVGYDYKDYVLCHKCHSEREEK